MFKKTFDGPNGAELLVKCLEDAGFTHCFGIPGAKIDPVFEALADSSIELVVCRHEQNAGFIAAAIGRLTERPGLCIGTSGPGTSNYGTPLITATTEGDPVLCLTGNVPQRQLHERTHQAMDNVGLMTPVTTYASEVEDADSVGEQVATAIQHSLTPPMGASYLSLPYNVMLDEAHGSPIPANAPSLGRASDADVAAVAEAVAQASCPVVLAGANCVQSGAAAAIRALLEAHPLPVVNTWEAAGIVPRDRQHCYLGRVGLFHNQPGDVALAKADVILAIGFEEVEYDPSLWNKDSNATLIHVSSRPADPIQDYRPTHQLVGDLGANITALKEALPELPAVEDRPGIPAIQEALADLDSSSASHDAFPVHPLNVVRQIQEVADEDPHTTVVCDVGSHYIWLGRHYRCYEPRHLLFSNGQQTLGVALPWAIATCIARPNTPVISMSGDGGLLFSIQELETAVRLGCNFTHLVWRDGTYDMVAFQQRKKYGRDYGIHFGEPDIVKLAEAFGATGYRVQAADELASLIRRGLDTPGPTLIDVPVDYSYNDALGAAMSENWQIH